MSKNQNPQFVMMPFKLFRLGLDGYEITIFAILRMHGDKDGQDIFPGYETIKSISGFSTDKVWKSLTSLKRCSIIDWEKGHKGSPNRYKILPIGHWKKKYSPPHGEIKEPKYSPPDGSTHSVTRKHPLRQTERFSPPDGTYLDPFLDPLTRSNNYCAHADEILKEVPNRELDPQKEARRQIEALMALEGVRSGNG